MHKQLTIFILLIIAAYILRLAYPPYYLWIAAVCAWTLLFYALTLTNRPFASGILFGASFSMMLCSWMFKTLLTYFDLGYIRSIIVFVLFISFIPSISFGFFTYTIKWFIDYFIKKSNGETSAINDFNISFFIASSFTLIEWIRTNLSPEHGWGHLATIFYNTPQILSFASIVGGPGLSFIIIFSSSLFLLFFYRIIWGNYKIAIINLAFPILLFSLIYMYGEFRMNHQNFASKNKIEIALIHPAIKQIHRWNKIYDRDNLLIYERMSLKAFESKQQDKNIRLIIWPETALTYNIISNKEALSTIKAIGKSKNAWLLIGAPSFQNNDQGNKCFNSAVLFSPEGDVAGRYDKKYLLPLAERHITVFNTRTKQNENLYSPGDDVYTLRIADVKSEYSVDIGTVICYEIGISSHVHEIIKKNINILINLSNDAWFGESSESSQQLSLLALKCAEYEIPGIRATGYGEAAFVNSFGKVLKKTNISDRTVLEGEIDISKISDKAKSVQYRFKDWFVVLCVLLCLMQIKKGISFII